MVFVHFVELNRLNAKSKQKSREKQRAKMGNEEFRKMRSKEIAEDRKRKKVVS
jgi:hypothetical protein